MDRPPLTGPARGNGGGDRPTPPDNLTQDLTDGGAVAGPREPADDAAATRARVYFLLKKGIAPALAARRLRLARQTVHGHAKALERAGAIVRVPGARSPLLFASGPRSEEFEAWVRRQIRDRVGRSASGSPSRAGGWQATLPGIRVHRGGYRVAIVAGPAREPPWSESWVASRVMNRAMRRDLAGKAWRFWEARGPRRAALIVQPPEVVLYNAADVARAERVRRKEAADVVLAFASEYGYEVRGAVVPTQPLEYGLEKPGVPVFGVPGESQIWGDESPGEGRSELETSDPRIAAAWAGLPVWQSEMEGRFAGLEAEVRAQRAALDRLLAIQEQMAGNVRRVVTAIVPPTGPPGGPGPEVH